MNKSITYLFQFFGSALCGFIVGLLFLFIGGNLLAPNDGFMPVAYALMGFFIGYPLGVFGGLLFTAKFLRQEGSWWKALIGLVGMFLIGVALIEPLRLNQNGFFLAVFLLFLPIAVGMLGFYFDRITLRD